MIFECAFCNVLLVRLGSPAFVLQRYDDWRQQTGARPAARRDVTILADACLRGQFRDRILAIDEPIAVRCAAAQVPDPRSERDSFIGATALVHRLVLVTRNIKDFEAMSGLDVLNPWEHRI